MQVVGGILIVTGIVVVRRSEARVVRDNASLLDRAPRLTSSPSTDDVRGAGGAWSSRRSPGQRPS